MSLVKLSFMNLMRRKSRTILALVGFAIGMFFWILPTFGVGRIFAIIFAQIFKASKIAALIGTLFTNPLTSPLFLSLSILIGSLFTGIQYNPDLFLTKK